MITRQMAGRGFYKPRTPKTSGKPPGAGRAECGRDAPGLDGNHLLTFTRDSRPQDRETIGSCSSWFRPTQEPSPWVTRLEPACPAVRRGARGLRPPRPAEPGGSATAGAVS